jgi:hypothetical protein
MYITNVQIALFLWELFIFGVFFLTSVILWIGFLYIWVDLSVGVGVEVHALVLSICFGFGLIVWVYYELCVCVFGICVSFNIFRKYECFFVRIPVAAESMRFTGSPR